jgi:hypothetical protein
MCEKPSGQDFDRKGVQATLWKTVQGIIHKAVPRHAGQTGKQR